jgi:hypothetical protein
MVGAEDDLNASTNRRGINHKHDRGVFNCSFGDQRFETIYSFTLLAVKDECRLSGFLLLEGTWMEALGKARGLRTRRH